jgi:hypothetical protein
MTDRDLYWALHDVKNFDFNVDFFFFKQMAIFFYCKTNSFYLKIHLRCFRDFIGIILLSFPILQKAISDFLL